MPLTPSQLTTLKTDILANTNTIQAGQANAGAFVGMQVKDIPNSSDGSLCVASWYNLPHATFIVWRDLPMTTVLGLITYASMTPADAVPTDTDLNIQIWKARSLACQGKQFNLQNLTIGRDTAPMRQTNYRAALQDCLTNLPAGAGGNLIAANWVGVRDAAKFAATNGEQLFATGTGTSGSPGNLVVQGNITASDVNSALNLS